MAAFFFLECLATLGTAAAGIGHLGAAESFLDFPGPQSLRTEKPFVPQILRRAYKSRSTSSSGGDT